MADKDGKKIDIPEKIANEVRAFRKALDDYDNELALIKRKKELVRNKMWLLIEENVPEAVGKACALDTDCKFIEVRPDLGNSIGDLLRNLGIGGIQIGGAE